MEDARKEKLARAESLRLSEAKEAARAVEVLHPTPYILKPFTLHSTPLTLHLQTLHSALYTPHSTPPDPTLCTVYTSLYTSKPYTLHSTPSTLRLGMQKAREKKEKEEEGARRDSPPLLTPKSLTPSLTTG